MKKYLVHYYFEGSGATIIKAKNKQEATDLFYQGEWKEYPEYDASTDYNLSDIKLKK